jgi:hypothetical protein
MRIEKSVKVKATLERLGVGDKVRLKMDSVSEISVRVAASRIKKETGAVYKVEREFPEIKVTRTA